VLEWGPVHLPSIQQLYLKSSRDQSFDKAVRLLRATRKQGQVAIGLEGGYVGHTIASARSLSDPAVHRGGPGHFNWPRIPHPTRVGVDASLQALREVVTAAGAEKIFGFFYELVQERTGEVLPRGFLEGLENVRSEFGIPLVAVESTTALYRSGEGAFASPTSGVMPDVILWWTGGQTGYVHCNSKIFVATPMALVSTWDGDELSLVRHHHWLRAARRIDVKSAAQELGHVMQQVSLRFGATAAGAGLYRVLRPQKDAGALVRALEANALAPNVLPNGNIVVAPKLDEVSDVIAALRRVKE